MKWGLLSLIPIDLILCRILSHTHGTVFCSLVLFSHSVRINFYGDTIGQLDSMSSHTISLDLFRSPLLRNIVIDLFSRPLYSMSVAVLSQ